MPPRLAVIASRESSHMGSMGRLERVLVVSALAEGAKSRAWDKRLYKHKATNGKI